MSLHTILTRHYQPSGLAGISGATALERELRRHSRLMLIGYSVLVAVLLALLFFVVWMVALDANEGRSMRTTILAGAGISCPFLLELMRRTIREWARTNLVVVLARRMDTAQMQSIIQALLSESQTVIKEQEH
jgi:hypothetical protein